MGINRWSKIEERKRNETDAKAGEELAAENEGTPPPACRPPKSPRKMRRSARSSRSSRNRSPSAEESPVRRYTQQVRCGEKHLWLFTSTNKP